MSRRDTLLSYFGPAILGGITLGDWITLLRENRFAVSPNCWIGAAVLSMRAGQNSTMRWWEELRYRSKAQNVTVQPPLFVLGHWRSGTTHLHNLISLDTRFAFPNNYQSIYPHTFLTTEKINSAIMARFLPKVRPMDNIQWTMQSPQEDEFALLIASLLSPYAGWVFPHRRAHYDRYLTLKDIPAEELALWQTTLLQFLKKLTLKYDRPLILKSPTHTCRIKLLLEMFPEAKFVHIHRDPYAVFLSTQRMFQINSYLNGLQRPRLHDLDDWILEQYRVMYDAYFAERDLIRAGQFHEIRFERLEAEPIAELRTMYESLNLPTFETVAPALLDYTRSIDGYQKNRFTELPSQTRASINSQWRRSFQAWNYPVQPA